MLLLLLLGCRYQGHLPLILLLELSSAAHVLLHVQAVGRHGACSTIHGFHRVQPMLHTENFISTPFWKHRCKRLHCALLFTSKRCSSQVKATGHGLLTQMCSLSCRCRGGLRRSLTVQLLLLLQVLQGRFLVSSACLPSSVRLVLPRLNNGRVHLRVHMSALERPCR